jgi:acyl-coenzyme A synthetase/AMP-(fatty) acid ligase
MTTAQMIVAVGGDAPLAWADLVRCAERLRRHLEDTGQRRPIVYCSDRFFTLASLLACWADDRVAILPPNARPETLRALLDAGRADGCLHDGGDRPGTDVRGACAPADAEAPPAETLRRYEDLLARDGAEHLVTVYTSGSTGAPVACPKTAAQLLGEARALVTAFDLGPASRVLATAPPHHIYGLLFGVLAPVLAEGAFVRQTPLHAAAIAELAGRFDATVLVAVPAHLDGLQALAPGTLPRFARVFSSGGRLSEEVAALVHERFGLPVTEVLGSSETGGIAWREAPGGAPWTALPGVTIAADADGTLLLESPFLDPGAPRPYHGSDRVEILAGGGFRHLGRADAILKIGGARVSLSEIEQRLLAVEGVRDAAAIARDASGPRQHEIWAAVVAPGLSVPALRGALLAWLDPVAIPRKLLLVPQLPREESGKLQRSRLASLFETAEPS